ncbi:MAG: UxaA family hydrolase [Peptococcaceae bacterium]|jgi:altronate dehydratase large subunit|nr:UxaA family hydrolase [Peptococcaceae bacterium]MDH7525374.1 UxaA family hydrolase [Peptococcaceae bacterium]
MELMGYQRANGQFGFRNYVAVLPAVGCANDVVNRLGQMYPGVLVLNHREGCAQLGEDKEQTARTLVGLGKNPNIAAILVVGLGCESITADYLANEIAKTGKVVESLVVQDEGANLQAIARGNIILKNMIHEVSKIKRIPCDLCNLTLGIKCGLTDTTSGISSNPATGIAADRIIEAGGTVIFGETPEVIGAEHILSKRAINEEVKKKLYHYVELCEKRVKASGMDIRGANPAPGNIKGGITSIEEKSLGAIKKAGSKQLQGVIGYGEIPCGRGLFFMDGPGRTPEALTGLNAAGAQVIVFSTGGGSPAGTRISPVIKVTGNPKTAEVKKDHIDVSVDAIIKGRMTIQEGGEIILNEIIEVASGKMSKAEVFGYGNISIWNIGVHM